ncbi:hypothetical protein FOCC_FOCC011143 [Frankliniella occidentalis]|nr:hypothetical protein FOCC_FOCC011143 [Frankliniella occidentalis]
MSICETQSKFLCNGKNKTLLINLLTGALQLAGVTVVHAEADADRLIVVKAIEVARGGTHCVVVGNDTDLLVLLIGLADKTLPLHLLSPASGRTGPKVRHIQSLLIARQYKKDEPRNILVAHPISGTDTVSDIINSFQSSIGHEDDLGPENNLRIANVEQNAVKAEISPRSKAVALNKELRDFTIKMNVSHAVVNGFLKIFKPYHDFLPTDARTLLGTTRDNCPIEKMGEGEFMYLGLEKCISKFLAARLTVINFRSITISVSIDGDSPFKCTKNQLWPILVKIEELPRSKPILVAAWFGRGHPPVQSFLEKFVKETNVVVQKGIFVNLTTSFEVKLKNFICDAPATAMIKMTKYHSGFYGCGKCFVMGESVAGCRVFKETNEKLRTDKNFREKLQKDHHKGDTPLLALPIDMIFSFPLDYLHLILIGALKRYLEVLKDGYVVGDGKPQYEVVHGKVKKKKKQRKGKLTQNVITAINKAIEHLRKFCPSEFSRICRSFSDSGIWKATEFRQFLLYIGVVVLKGLISKEQYDLFLKLHVATRIFCSKSLCLKLGRVADDLMKSFVKESPKVCGKSFPTYCIHNLCHVYEDVKWQGQPLDSFSAFPFESFHGTLKNLLRGRAKPLPQLYKRMQEKENQPDLNEEIYFPPSLSYSHDDGPTCGLKGIQYHQLKMDSFKYSVKHAKDSYMVLRNGTVIKAHNFIKLGNKISVVGRFFTKSQDLYIKPVKSSLLGITVVSGLSPHILHWALDDVKAKAHVMPLNSRIGLGAGWGMDAQFAIVEFTKEKNQKESVPIEIVPMIWIHAKGKKTYWPSKPRITAKEMKALVEELTDPNSGDKEDWVAPPCKILRTSRTYDGACARLKRLRRQAVVSSSQSDREDDDEDDEDEEDEEEKKRYRKRRNTKQDSDNEDDSEGSGSNDELDSSLLSPGVFDDFDW